MLENIYDSNFFYLRSHIWKPFIEDKMVQNNGFFRIGRENLNSSYSTY